MGLLNNIWKGIGKFISKNIFGLDTTQNNKTISVLNKELEKLRQENIELRNRLKSQEILLEECEKAFIDLDESLNKFIEFKLYASIFSSKNESKTTFEFRHRGVVKQMYEDEEILDFYDTKSHLQELLDKFKIKWIDLGMVASNWTSGVSSHLTQEMTTSDFNVEFSVDSGGGFAPRITPNVKVVNHFD